MVPFQTPMSGVVAAGDKAGTHRPPPEATAARLASCRADSSSGRAGWRARRVRCVAGGREHTDKAGRSAARRRRRSRMPWPYESAQQLGTAWGLPNALGDAVPSARESLLQYATPR